MQIKRDKVMAEIMSNMDLIRQQVFSRKAEQNISCEISPAQGHILVIVAAQPGISIKEIAALMQVSGSAVTQMVNTLVAAGMVAREEDARDRRTQRVYLTPEGQQKFQAFNDIRKQMFDKTFMPLSDEELLQFGNLFAKIIDNLLKYHGGKAES